MKCMRVLSYWVSKWCNDGHHSMKGRLFHFSGSKKEEKEGKERRLERGGEERKEVNEQYVSVERAAGKKRRNAKASGLMWAFFWQL